MKSTCENSQRCQYLRGLRPWYLGLDVSLVYIINTSEAEEGSSHKAEGQNHAKNGREELKMHRSQRPTQAPYGELAHEIYDDDPAKLNHTPGNGGQPPPPEV